MRDAVNLHFINPEHLFRAVVGVSDHGFFIAVPPGVFKNVQSQRYVKPDDLEVYVKKELQLDPRIAYDINIYEYQLKKVYENIYNILVNLRRKEVKKWKNLI